MKAPATLQFLGATGTVTGSKFLVTYGSRRVLVDCGLYQGQRELRERNWRDLPFAPDSLDAVVLTHAHIDHSGYLPRLVAHGFSGPVYATTRTCELARIVLPDCGHLNEEEAEFANRKGYSRHHPALPLYTEDDARRALTQLVPVDYHRSIPVAAGVDARLTPAGHILGAASIAVHLDRRPDRAAVVFSGDLGRSTHPFLVGPEPPPAADHLVVESTYGDRVHDDRDSAAVLGTTIAETIDGGGSVIIPAFAVDRTEVILHHLADLVRDRVLSADLPIFVDSPMALSALRVYRAAIDGGDSDVRREFHGTDPFALPSLTKVHDVEGSKALNRPARPSVIISAAGMASGGRVVHHLAHALPDRRNTVILVGYQAIGTRGRQLLDGATELKMLGRYVAVKARVVNLPQFSVHADADELVEWVGATPRQPSSVFVVHGEQAASNALVERIHKALDWTAVVPRFTERVLIG